MTTRLRAVIVDDSPLVRAVLREVLEHDGDIDVIAEAGDGYEALASIREGKPDVVTMDLSMPGAGGLEAVSWVMASCPVPILIVTGEPLGDDADVGFEAMQRGAVDLIPKSALNVSSDGDARFREQVRIAAATPVFAYAGTGVAAPTTAPSVPEMRIVGELIERTSAPAAVIAVAAGKGGAFAVTDLLAALPHDLPCPVLVALPLPPGYEEAYARFLRGRLALAVVVVPRGGVELAPGTVFIAGGRAHLVVEGARALLRDGRAEQTALPSGDLLFQSVAEAYGASAIGVVLAGRGGDGAAGLRALREARAMTMAEATKSASTDEMPSAARPHAVRVLPLQLLSDALVSILVTETAPRTRRPPAPTETARAPRIYLLDDSPIVLAMTTAALQTAGYEVASATTIAGFEALFAGGAPDLIIVDVDMPEMYGHDVATVLRQVRHVRAPIFLFSSFDKRELAATLREAPVDGYFSKSEGIEALLEGVRATLHRR